ncbi:MAG: ADP-ribosylglycohydrolase family protein [Desulfobacterota bacterium]|nr:ADP-ribosylglycohydrolase family protein [Thermodesulfobacteriota bacterium]
MDKTAALNRALLSLEGLSLGDAFGELFFSISPVSVKAEELPPGPWRWTDDTHMAISIVEILKTHGRIDQDALARAFARRYGEEPYRGYAGGASRLLRALLDGADWREVSPRLFGGGSYGNGAAMRASPIGGYFTEDPERAAYEAQRSAVVTHAHIEGQVGAMAVAVAAALAGGAAPPAGGEFLREVLKFLPESLTRDRIRLAMEIPPDRLEEAVLRLGNGSEVSAQDTVPFCLWSAAHHLFDFEEALWWTVRGLGDRDTTCAIVGGIVALSALNLPSEWLDRREPLPSF